MRIDVGEQDNGRRLDVHLGDVIRIVLPENATTGYRWAAEPVHGAQLAAVRDETEPAGAVPGLGGRRILEVRADRAGEFTIRLRHYRQWKGPESAIAVFELSGTVS